MTPLEDDNILEQILLRLLTCPSSLPRAAAVCKRWRRLMSDPHFRRRFRAHHREPPLLGIFLRPIGMGHVFHSILDPTDAIPLKRFSFWAHHDAADVVIDRELQKCLEFIVWDPVTGNRRCAAVPPEFENKDMFFNNSAVLCAAGDQSHVHSGECDTNHFQVVLIGCFGDGTEWFRCVYSSVTGEWGDISSTATPGIYNMRTPVFLKLTPTYDLFSFFISI
ncbi:hypothetical protein PR202_ga07527 [Eleusine coracana subsp. coracana]|uniref:F-box domain-containing protein n=1 Tax=Eleusine coracana subsp. coracana TaxID=191504 RepID=A0AAV5C067_ELECO|nr:hypothetical protein PR202_ga07527 [Eleusine coracana subsp. coracana]